MRALSAALALSSLLASPGCGDVSRDADARDPLQPEEPGSGSPDEEEGGALPRVPPPGSTEVLPDQLVDGSRYDVLHPSVASDLLTWIDLADDEDGACYRPRGEDNTCTVRIVAMDLSTDERKVVASELPQLVFPKAVDGDRVAWTGHDGRVRSWDFATGTTKVISRGDGGGSGPVAAGGGTVAWFSNRWDSRGVWVWDPETDLHRLPLDRWVDVGSGVRPALGVHGTRVALLRNHQRETHQWWQDLWTGDIATRDQSGTWLEPDDDGHAYAPALAGAWVVYKAWFPDDQGCWETTCEHQVFARSRDGAEELRLDGEDARPSSVSGLVTDGPRVAWLEVSGPVYRAVVADLATGTRIAESPSGARPVGTSLPALSSRWLVWTDAGMGRLTLAGLRL